jgi:hypothetical protein
MYIYKDGLKREYAHGQVDLIAFAFRFKLVCFAEMTSIHLKLFSSISESLILRLKLFLLG